jgi:uncharacterized protein (TIGR02598 family)
MNRHTDKRIAFSLIEVTLALGIAAFCLLSVFGLLPIGLDTSQNASEQTVVAGIATAVSADLHGIPVISSTGATTSRFQFNIPGPTNYSPARATQTLYFSGAGESIGLPNDDANPSVKPTPRYRVTLTMYQDPTIAAIDTHTKFYKAWILITWPGLADSKAKLFPINFAGSYEAVTSLNYFSNP